MPPKRGSFICELGWKKVGFVIGKILDTEAKQSIASFAIRHRTAGSRKIIRQKQLIRIKN